MTGEQKVLSHTEIKLLRFEKAVMALKSANLSKGLVGLSTQIIFVELVNARSNCLESVRSSLQHFACGVVRPRVLEAFMNPGAFLNVCRCGVNGCHNGTRGGIRLVPGMYSFGLKSVKRFFHRFRNTIESCKTPEIVY